MFLAVLLLLGHRQRDAGTTGWGQQSKIAGTVK